YPILHQEGIQNILFDWPRILGWMLYGIFSSIIIFFFCTRSIFHQAFRRDGRVAGLEVLGVYLYSCVVWAVNCQVIVSTSYFTWIQHLFIWGSIASWYIFLIIFGSFPPTESTTAYKVLVEACGPSPLYWLTGLLVVISALLPYFCVRVIEVNVFPTYHHIIQRKEVQKAGTPSSSGYLPELITESDI
ncbi:Phospholipid-transporting atpase, partial [Thalictrum thalictroides]